MPNRPRLYDFTRRDHVSVRSVVKQVDHDTKDPMVDGIIVIVARKHGRKTKTYVGGSLANSDKATRQAVRLQLSLAFDDEESQE